MHVAGAEVTLQLESMLHNHVSGAEPCVRGFNTLKQSQMRATQEYGSEMNGNPVRRETLLQNDMGC